MIVVEQSGQTERQDAGEVLPNINLSSSGRKCASQEAAVTFPQDTGDAL